MIDWKTLARMLGAGPAALWKDWITTHVVNSDPDRNTAHELDVADQTDPEEITAAIDRRRQAAIARRQGAVTVVPIRGIIIPRPNIFELVGLATSVQTIVETTRAALQDPNVKAVVHAYDSPGGSVAGVPEGFADLYAMRGDKPIIAVAEHLMASGAYWLGSATDEIVAAPSALVGSVGVYMLHLDFSGFDEALGVKATFIYAGEHKVDGNEYEPLSDSAREHYQSLVDDVYQQFTADVARGRGVQASAVRGESFGQGRVLTATDARGRGMIDQVRTLRETLSTYGVETAPANTRAQVSAIERRRRSVGMLEQGI